jgi:hypothetical protein
MPFPSLNCFEAFLCQLFKNDHILFIPVLLIPQMGHKLLDSQTADEKVSINAECGT